MPYMKIISEPKFVISNNYLSQGETFIFHDN